MTKTNKFRKIVSLMFGLFMVGVLTLSSCSSDDGNKSQNNLEATYTFESTGNFQIPDNDTNGIYAPVNVDLPEGVEITDIYVSLNIGHPFAGDLSIWLLSPAEGAIRVALMDRPGYPVTTFGSSADFLIDNAITFKDGVPIPSEDIGTTAVGGFIPAGTFAPSWTALNPLPNGHYTSFTSLIAALPDDVNGEWKFYIRDSAGGDTGSFENVKITFVNGNTAN